MNETNLSERAIASRANGAKSRGPTTEEGKRRSSQNALRHGLLADIVVLKHESKEIFQLVHDQHIRKFNPADDVEHDAVEEMAAAHWRLRRLWAIQTNLMNHCMDNLTPPAGLNHVSAAFSELSATKQLDQLDRYEARLTRSYQRSLQTLMVLKSLDSPDQSDSAEQPSAEIAPESNEPDNVYPPDEIPPQPNEPRQEAATGITTEPAAATSDRQEPAILDANQSLPAQRQLPLEALHLVNQDDASESYVPPPPHAVESAYGQINYAATCNFLFIQRA